MYKVYYFLLLIGCVSILSNCQGRGGGGGGHSHTGSRGSQCTTDLCRYWEYLIGGITFVVLFVWLCSCCSKLRKGHPSEKNLQFVESNAGHFQQQTYEMQHMYETNIFASGIWFGRYFQYGTWHGPHQMSLSFDNRSMKVTGSGWDNVGSFTIAGTYSEQTRRIGLKKYYRASTGNKRENSGHKVVIQLVYNAHTNQFEGTWYIKFNGEDNFVLASRPTYQQV